MIFRRRKHESSPEIREAEQAVEDTRQRLAETRAQTPTIRALAAQLREARTENHFADRIRDALEGQ